MIVILLVPPLLADGPFWVFRSRSAEFREFFGGGLTNIFGIFL